MLRITKDASNEMTVTVTEKTTVVIPTYLFHFRHVATLQDKYFILANTSLNTGRYDTFTFTEGSDADHTLREGTQVYNIYAQSDSENLDPDSADELVEEGLCDVIGTITDRNSHEISPNINEHDIDADY